MTTETPTPQTTLRPVSGNPDVHHSYGDDDWDLEAPIDPRVGWSLSYGCKVTVGFDGDVLHVTVSTCDRDQRDGITKRAVTREQVADYARKLAALVGVDASEVDSLRAEVADAREEIESRRMHDEATTYHLNVALWLHAEARAEVEQVHGNLLLRQEQLGESAEEIERLTAENAELRHALSVAEQYEVDVRLEVERDLRDEAAKAGA